MQRESSLESVPADTLTMGPPIAAPDHADPVWFSRWIAQLGPQNLSSGLRTGVVR